MVKYYMTVLLFLVCMTSCDRPDNGKQSLNTNIEDFKPNIKILSIKPDISRMLKLTDTITVKCSYDLIDLRQGIEYGIEMVFEPKNFTYNGSASLYAYIGLLYPEESYFDTTKTGEVTLRCPVSLIAAKEEIKKKPLLLSIQTLSTSKTSKGGVFELWMNGYSEIITYDLGIEEQ